VVGHAIRMTMDTIDAERPAKVRAQQGSYNNSSSRPALPGSILQAHRSHCHTIARQPTLSNPNAGDLLPPSCRPPALPQSLSQHRRLLVARSTGRHRCAATGGSRPTWPRSGPHRAHNNVTGRQPPHRAHNCCIDGRPQPSSPTTRTVQTRRRYRPSGTQHHHPTTSRDAAAGCSPRSPAQARGEKTSLSPMPTGLCPVAPSSIG
jgi:hypothetical protein